MSPFHHGMAHSTLVRTPAMKIKTSIPVLGVISVGFAPLLMCFLPVSVATMRAQTTSSEEVIVLSPFTVSTTGDNPYRLQSTTSAALISQPIVDSPLSISTISGELMGELSLTDLTDLKKYSASLDQSIGGTGFGSEFNARGFRADTLNSGHRTRQFGDTALIDRVEIVKGPMATLYGESGGGGVVNLTLKQAVISKTFGSLKLSVDSVSSRRVVFDYNTTLNLAGLPGAIRVIAFDANMGSHIKSWYEKRTGAYLTTTFRPVERVLVTLRADTLESRKPGSHQDNIVPIDLNANGRTDIDFPHNAGFGPTFNALAPNGRWDWSQQTGSADVVVDIADNVIFRSAALWMSQKNDAVDSWTNGSVSANSVRRVDFHDRLRKTQSFKQDLLLRHEWPEVKFAAKLILGLEHYVSSDDNKRTQYELPVGTFPLIPNPRLGQTPTWQDIMLPELYIIRTQGTVRAAGSIPGKLDTSTTDAQRATLLLDFLDERVRVIGGYRRNDGDFIGDQLSTSGVLSTTVVGFKENTRQYGISGDLIRDKDGKKGINRLTAYYSGGTTFIPPRQSNPPNIIGAPAILTPETGTGWDLGLKFEALNGKISGSLAYFDLTRDNVIVNVPNPVLGSPSFFINAGKQVATGYEFESTLSMNRQWDVTLQYTRITGRTVSDPNDPAIVGAPLTSPKDRYTIWSNYRFTEGGLAGFSCGIGYSYTSDIFAHGARSSNLDRVLPAFGVVNARLAYKFKLLKHDASFSVNVENAADELYVTRSEANQFVTGPTRKFSATLDLKF
jgi:iron complex outermembrane recepter protein